MSGEFSYIGRDTCGCIVAAVVDSANKETAKHVANFIKWGLSVERVTSEFVRTDKTNTWFNCPHKAKGKTKKANQPSLLPEGDSS